MGDQTLWNPQTRALERFAEAVEDVTLPPGVPPLIERDERTPPAGDRRTQHPYALYWLDCPGAIYVRGLASELIAVRVHRCGESRTFKESIDDLLVFRRLDVEAVAGFLRQIMAREPRPMLHTWGESAPG